MVVVDAHSKWLEVFPMSTTTTEKTLEVLRNLFASYRLPEQIVSDNGPQFTSHEFELCMKANGIKHIKTSPYHPASNGEAERFVQTFKQAMRAGKSDSYGIPECEVSQVSVNLQVYSEYHNWSDACRVVPETSATYETRLAETLVTESNENKTG